MHAVDACDVVEVVDDVYISWLKFLGSHQTVQGVLKIAFHVLRGEASPAILLIQRIREAQDRLCKHMVQSGNACVCLNAFSAEDYGLLVPAKLECRLNEGHHYSEPELTHTDVVGTIWMHLFFMISTVVVDQVSCDLIDLEGLLILAILVEGVTLGFELLCIGKLVEKVR